MSDDRLIVFDLDGTLVDSRRDLIPALNFALASENLPPMNTESVGHLVGHGLRAMVERAFDHLGHPLDEAKADGLSAICLDHYTRNITTNTGLFDGVEAALERFSSEGWRFAICSNKPEVLSVKLLSNLKMDHLFEAICGGDTFVMRKPDPEHLLRTIEKAGGQAENTVMVGDSVTDIRTAQSAGIPIVAVSFGYSDAPVETYSPDRVIDHFDHLFQAVEELTDF